MPVSLEQQRAAVGAMARSAAPKPHSPVGPNWNKWLRASDPMAYKACIILLVTIVWMAVSGVKQGTETMKVMVEEGCEGVCWLASRGKPRVMAMWMSSRAVLATLFVSHLMILVLCQSYSCRKLQLHYHYDTYGAGMTAGSLASLQLSETKKPGVCEVAMLVFVIQMLLMIAGDVEPNPGPDVLTSEDIATLVNELNEVRDKWYHIGIQLNIEVSELDCIRLQYRNNLKDCLLEMLTEWLSRIKPSLPTWRRVADALSSPAVDKPAVALRIRQTYCSDQELADHQIEVQCPGFLTKEEIESEMEMLENEFEELKDDVYYSVKTQPVEVFIVKLTSFKVRDKECHMDYIMKIVHKKCSVTEVWVELNKYFNFLNHTILQHILTKFKNRELQKRMDKYKDKLHTFFRKTRLCDFVQCWPMEKQAPETELKNYVTKSKMDWETCTLEDLHSLKGKLATKLLLPDFALMLTSFSKGCVAVTFSVSTYLVDYLKTFTKEIELREFAELEIESITVDGVVCYEDPLLQYTTVLKQLYSSRSPLQPLSGTKLRDLLPFRLARIEKQMILSSSDLDRFTRETLRGDMDDVVYKKTAMELGGLGAMKGGSQPQVVLIEGAPGVGKTTFAWDQCRQWAEGKVLEDYSIVLLLPLRDNNIRQMRSLPDLFQHSRGQVREEVRRRVAESGGKGCLIWLEAWDELPSYLCRSDSFFNQLIQGIQLPAATIFITSRPWATRGLLEMAGKRLSQHTELLALAKEEVENEIRSMIVAINYEIGPASGFDFSQFIDTNPMIRAAMYTPISASIVHQVFRSVPHNPPTTLTQLYSAFILLKIDQHLSSTPKYSYMKMKWKRLDDLPEEVAADLRVLCSLAYEGVSQQTIVFSNLPGGVSTLGLLQAVPQVYDEGEDRVSYNFLHYTVQEYLAALHLSHLPPQQLLTLTRNECLRVTRDYGKSYYEATHYRTTFQFLAGITKLELFTPEFLANLLEKDGATLYRWLYESQNQAVLTSVLGSGRRWMKLSYSATTADYFAAGYCLAHSECTWRIDFIHISVDDTGMEFFSKGCNHQLLKVGTSSGIDAVSLRNGSITGGVGHLLTIPASPLKHILHLDFNSNQVDKRGCELLAEGVKMMPYLQNLDLNDNTSIGCGGIVKLVSSLHSSQLKELGISNTGIGDPDFQCLASYIKSTLSLQKLRMGGNVISVTSMDAICRALSVNSSIRLLYLYDATLTDSHCACLGQLLKNPMHCLIEKLDLSRCGLTDDGVGEIMSGVSDNRTINELFLSFNPMTSYGLVTVATGLKVNSSLRRLDLEECGIDSDGGVELGAALEINKTLKRLKLSGNSLGYNGIRGLCVGLENNSSLEELQLFGDESLGEEGVTELFKCVELGKNSRLKKLMLPEKFKRDVSSELRLKCRVLWF